jgi:fatty aldehyde decarbonylase
VEPFVSSPRRRSRVAPRVLLTREHPDFKAVYGGIVSHIVTGESVGMEHYARLVSATRDLGERLEFLEEAWTEGRHLSSMLGLAERLSLAITWSGDDHYWGRVREFFGERLAASDLASCRLVQDVILESFAVALYDSILPRLEPTVAEAVRVMLADEREHLEHGVAAMRERVLEDPEGTASRVERANDAVARLLAGWIVEDDCAPECGVCRALVRRCLKRDLQGMGVELARARAQFLSLYGGALREAGFAPAPVTRWLARLPA